jgi:hypothetical protein
MLGYGAIMGWGGQPSWLPLGTGTSPSTRSCRTKSRRCQWCGRPYASRAVWAPSCKLVAGPLPKCCSSAQLKQAQQCGKQPAAFQAAAGLPTCVQWGGSLQPLRGAPWLACMQHRWPCTHRPLVGWLAAFCQGCCPGWATPLAASCQAPAPAQPLGGPFWLHLLCSQACQRMCQCFLKAALATCATSPSWPPMPT